MELLNSEDNAVRDNDVRLIVKIKKQNDDDSIICIDPQALKRMVSDAAKYKTLNSLYGALSPCNSDRDDVVEYARVYVTTTLNNNQKTAINGLTFVSETLFHVVTLIGDDALMKNIVKASGIAAARKGILSTYRYTFEMGGEHCPRQVNCIQLAAMQGHTALVDRFHDIIEPFNTPPQRADLGMFETKNNDEINNRAACELTPLMLAARFGHEETVKKVIELRLQCNSSAYSTDYRTTGGYSALHFAACYNHIEALKLIAELGKANINAQTRGHLKYAIVFSAALGYVSMVQYLFDRTDRDGRRRAIHAAAAMASDKVIEVLLTKDITLKNATDKDGNTPLAIALKGNRVATADTLLYFGIARNPIESLVISPAQGNSTSTTARHQSRPKSASELVAKAFRQGRSQNHSNVDASIIGLKDSNLIDLFHAAALQDDVKQIEELIGCELSPEIADHRENTFLHVAASENKVKVLERFMFRFEHLVEKKNSYGETPLHIAVRKGHVPAVRTLVKHIASLGVTDNNSCTPLHIAVKFGRGDIVKEIVNAILSAGWMSLLESVDDRSRTALHYAVICYKRNEPDIIKILSALNPGPTSEHLSMSDIHELSNSALHLAAAMLKTEVLKLILETFYSKQTSQSNIDKLDITGRTALMICAENENTDATELLMNYGAKLDTKDAKGLTVLHRMVLLTVEDPDNAGSMLNFYRRMVASRKLSKDSIMVADNSMAHDNGNDFLMLRDIFAHALGEQERTERCKWCAYDEVVDVKKHLLTHVYSVIDRYLDVCPEGMTVIQLAAAVGADDMLREFLNENFNIASHKLTIDARYLEYKPYNIVPLSLFTNELLVPDVSVGPSCLELIAYVSCQHAVQMIEIEPLKTFVNKFSRLRSFVFILLTVSHIVHMACFSITVLPTCNGYSSTQWHQISLYQMSRFLIWPSMVFVYLACRSVMFIYRLITRKLQCFGCRCTTNVADAKQVVLQYVVFKMVTYMSSFAFFFLTITWFVLLSQINTVKYEIYAQLLSVLFIAGWMHTIEYIKGIEYFHAFSNYLKFIFFKDILRFGFIYVFVLIGFSLAIHVYIQQDVGSVTSNMNISMLSTAFDTFGLMVGASSVYDTSNGPFGNLPLGRNPNSSKVIFTVYLCLSTIMLLNMLIAMMNRSYKAIENEIHLLWRYENIKLLVDLSTSQVNLILRPTRRLLRRFVFHNDKKECDATVATVMVELDEQSRTHNLLVSRPSRNMRSITPSMKHADKP